MKNNLLFFIVLGFFINNSIELVASALDDSAIEEISELNKFFEKYKLPEDIIDIFNAHSDAILFSKYYEKFKQLP